MLIGQLAKAAGVKTDTVRFYEKSRLLPEPARTASGYRLYDEEALRQLRFIRQAQALGFSLEEIRRILRWRGNGRDTCDCVIGMAESTLARTDAKLRELQAFHDRLAAQLKRWHKQIETESDFGADFCKLIETTASDDS